MAHQTEVPPPTVSINIHVEEPLVFSNDKQRDNNLPKRSPEKLLDSGTQNAERIGSESENDSADEKSIKRKGKKLGIFVFLLAFESVAFACAVVLFVMSFTMDRLHKPVFWDLGLWKLCLLLFTIICGRLISQLFTMLILFLIWRFWANERALYFGYGVRKSILLFVWVGLVALAWVLIVDRSKYKTDIVKDVTRGLAGCLIGAFLWLMKSFLVKLVGSVHATKLLDKTKEAICVRKLLISLLKKEESEHRHVNSIEEFVNLVATKLFDKKIEPEKHDNDRVSRRTMRELMNAIRGKKLLPLPHGDEKDIDGDDKKPDQAAEEAAADIFAKLEPDSNGYISLEKILQSVKEKKVIDQLKGLAEGKTDDESIKRSNGHITSEDLKIEESVFKDWMVEVYREHDSLNSTLKHSKTAMDELNVIASVIVLFIVIVMWLLFMGFLTTKVLVFLSTQLLLAVFMFGNSVKTVFEAVIFVFLVHPFDVGDRCVINGIQMVVDEMNILTTTFLRHDNEKIYYPNAVLATKPISNLYRSPPMNETLNFAVSLHTPNQTIEKLRERIKTYLLKNPRWWHPDHSLRFTEIEDVNKMKLTLFVNHTINFHYIGKRLKRRSELVLEMKNLFEELKIEYHLLPQQVNLIGSVRCLPHQFD
ncbi:mechanosensitive ion channel protein 10-like [Euphorbia lathyris]|uniref:mechanosensitive ion channel protein 10-like n=1 Tax=Euphorbia lathyris TaxID=212925 RepID=UPI003313311B